MNKKFSEVTILPAVFYKQDGELNDELIIDIFKKAAQNSKIRYGSFLKIHCNMLSNKKFISLKHRYDFIVKLLQDPEKRKKWYRKIERKDKKSDSSKFSNFFNCVYSFVNESSFNLDIYSEEYEEYVCEENGKTFLSTKKVQQLIEKLLKKDIDKKSISLFLWAFIEAHLWNAVDDKELLSERVKNALETIGEYEILNLCMPPLEDTKEPIDVDLEPKKENLDYANQVSIDDRNCSEALAVLRNLVKDYFELKDETENNLHNGDYKKAQDNIKKLEQFEKSLNKKFEEITNEFIQDGISSKPPDKPENLLTSQEFAYNYLDQFESAANRNILFEKKQLSQQKEALSRHFQSLNLPVPEELENAETINEFNYCKRLWELKLKLEKVIQLCIKDGIDGSGLHDIESSNRFVIYKRLDSESDFNHFGDLLTFIINDLDALDSEPEKGLKLILSVVKKCLQHGLPLPPGTWLVIRNLNNGNLFELLQKQDILQLLDCQINVDIEGFYTAFEGDIELLPKHLALKLELCAIRQLEPKKQIPKFSDMIAEQTDKWDVAHLLITALIESKNYGEALYLFAMGSRVGQLSMPESKLRDILVMVMINSQLDNNDEQISITDHFLEHYDWLTNRDEDVVALLYFIAHYDLENIYINFQYQYPMKLESARKAFPAMVNYLIEMIEMKETDPTDTDKHMPSVLRGQKALIAFEHDLQKSSCFLNWPEAKKYQQYFRKRLETDFERLKNGKKIQTIEPDQIIEQTQKDRNLLHPFSKPKRKMKQYLDTQSKRLNIIQKAITYTSFENILKQTLETIDELKKESKNISDDNALRIIYNRLIEEH